MHDCILLDWTDWLCTVTCTFDKMFRKIFSFFGRERNKKKGQERDLEKLNIEEGDGNMNPKVGKTKGAILRQNH